MNNQEILKSYVPLVEFIGKICGINYEIVLHDASNFENSIICIVNGHISGREVGGPITNLALKLIKEEYYKKQDYVVNNGRTIDNKILNSSTFFIKNNDQELIGLLCVNNNLTELISFNNYLSGLLDSFYNKTDNKETTENIDISMDDLIKNTMESVFSGISISPERMSPEEKKQIVHNLSDQGVFLLKGAVSEVAQRLKTSEPTIYRYLNKKR
ncbi:helix-turn-helix transcriptional regulator [Brevibacillus sp. NRS-1366]|uniref:helix-turn-helix transcriptional regulator n=1 Tax=Brevibacillus sp. NRS-1366 TaxID=3233899 RepID=UPI003D22676C